VSENYPWTPPPDDLGGTQFTGEHDDEPDVPLEPNPPDEDEEEEEEMDGEEDS
jgi:hypothetical protein